MKKKIISLVVLCVLALSAGLYYYIHQPKNIFDEIYQETMNSGYVFRQLSDVEVKSQEIYDDNMNETGKHTVVINYIDEALPEDCANIVINFYPELGKDMSIRFEWQPNSDITIWYLSYYKRNSKTLTKEVAIFDEPRKAGEYIDDETQVKAYLEQYHISSVDLDKHYNEIVNQKVLTDWCSIYDSKFSPEDYGDVTVKTQWENW
ncbi:TipC family immunity protein [uncultured Streptococcus sp.]|uniref:TipC family immunity protein n=1 Tax=uncultured Streptococcus sp. TaxID=83427 RepID=UPI0028E8F1B0|nr:TipC family immunity protein [uncultured Streptococcus sp.]